MVEVLEIASKHSLVEELRPGGLATFAGYVKRGGRKKLVEDLRPGGLTTFAGYVNRSALLFPCGTGTFVSLANDRSALFFRCGTGTIER